MASSAPFARPGLRTAGTNPVLRAHMVRVFNLTGLGVLGSAIVSWIVSATPALLSALYAVHANGHLGPTGLGYLVMFSPLAIVLVSSFGRDRLPTSVLFLLYAALCTTIGASLSTIFLAFTSVSILRIFFETSILFCAMALWGYATKRDLSGMSSFLFMGLLGVILAGVINLFLHSSMLAFLGNAAGVLVFVGLTAMNVQQAKLDGLSIRAGSDGAIRMAIQSSISLYLDFINLFMSLLNLFGDRR